MKYHMTIPECPPSLNLVLNMHFRDKMALRDKWISWVRANMPEFPPKLKTKMRATITLCHSRMFDQDNLLGSVKPVLDALRHNRLIWDDRPEFLELDVQQAKAPRKAPKTIIELEAV